MFFAPIAALLALAEPAGPPPASDEQEVVAEPPSLAIVPAAEPMAPAAEPAPEVPATPPPAPPPVRPAAGFGIEVGYARGGERFITIPSLPPGSEKTAHAGDGVFFALAGSWMPYWSKRGVGLGLYVRAGAKFVGLADGTTTASFLRIPVAAGAQLLLPVVGRWFGLGRIGFLTEPLADLTFMTDGVSRSSRDFSLRLGEFADAGIYWAATPYSGFAAIVRYERLDVSYSGGTTNANNLGGLAAAYLAF